MNTLLSALDATYAALESNLPVARKPYRDGASGVDRPELSIWRDAQGRERFRFDGVTWEAGYMPADVRATYLREQIRIERNITTPHESTQTKSTTAHH